MSTVHRSDTSRDEWLAKVNATPPAELFGRAEPFQWLMGAVSSLALLGVVLLFANAQIDWAVSAEYLFNDRILQGLANTVVITLVSFAIGLVLGIVFGMMRLSRSRVVRGIAWLYVWTFRGTPLLVQLLVWFNIAMILPTIWLPGLGEVRTVTVMTPFVTALVGLAINEGAYLSEVIRAGIISVDHGQFEAGQALGMSRSRTMVTIILPQAMPAVLPNLGNSAIGMLKTSSLASIVAFPELLNQAQSLYFVNGHVMEILMVVAAWYLVATSALSVGQYYLEKHFGRSDHTQRLSWVDRALSRAVKNGMRKVDRHVSSTASEA